MPTAQDRDPPTPLQLPAIEPLVAGRSCVRAVREADLPDLLEVNGDDEVTRFLPYDSWRGLADARAWYERMQALEAGGTSRQLVVERLADHRVIGTALLFRFDASAGSVELGYVIGRSCWRQGYAREAIGTLCRHAFDVMGVRRIEAHVDVLNTASGALARGLGFVHEGRRRQCWVTRGRVRDGDLYGCLATDLAVSPP